MHSSQCHCPPECEVRPTTSSSDRSAWWGEHVTLGKGTRLLSHVTVEGWTEIGERCELHPFVSIGGPPQHLGYKDEPTKVVAEMTTSSAKVTVNGRQCRAAV